MAHTKKEKKADSDINGAESFDALMKALLAVPPKERKEGKERARKNSRKQKDK